MDESLKGDDMIYLGIAKSALELKKLGFLKTLFQKDFVQVQENDMTIVDIWYRVQAMELAEQRGVSNDASLLNEVYETLDPPENLDFRPY